MGVGGQRHAPAALLPGKIRYPLYRRMGGPQDRFGRARKISPPPGFDPRTVQPVASRYTDWAIQAPLIDIKNHKVAGAWGAGDPAALGDIVQVGQTMWIFYIRKWVSAINRPQISLSNVWKLKSDWDFFIIIIIIIMTSERLGIAPVP